MAALVLVAGRQPYLERGTGAVDRYVVAAAGAGQERARDLPAPFFAATSDASTITRERSSRPAAASSNCSSCSSCGSSPRRPHSSNRRRQVSPLGSPSSR